MDEKKTDQANASISKKMINFLKIAKFQKVVKSLKTSKYEWKLTILLEYQVKIREKIPFKQSNRQKNHVH